MFWGPRRVRLLCKSGAKGPEAKGSEGRGVMRVGEAHSDCYLLGLALTMFSLFCFLSRLSHRNAQYYIYKAVPQLNCVQYFVQLRLCFESSNKIVTN